MILRHQAIITLTTSALLLGLLWTGNAYALDNTKPAPATVTPNKSSTITITSDSNSVYSIPSTFVKVDRFSANYTIAGKISSLNNFFKKKLNKIQTGIVISILALGQ